MRDAPARPPTEGGAAGASRTQEGAGIVEFAEQFVGAIPEAASALWELGDGWRTVGVLIGATVLMAVFGFLALRWRDAHGWLSAILGVKAGFIAFWLVFGMVPSGWMFFADGERDLLEGTLLPGPVGPFEDLYEVVRDLVTVGLLGVGLLAFGVAAVWIQRRFPRSLTPEEDQGAPTGGYR